jgi:hypothetical protein
MNILIALPIQYLFPNKLFKKRIFCYFCFITYIKHFNLGSSAQLHPMHLHQRGPSYVKREDALPIKSISLQTARIVSNQ